MPMHIPDDAANVSYQFRCDGVDDEMGFSLGVVPALGDSANSVADAAGAAFRAHFAATTAAVLVGWTYLGTRVTLMRSGEPFPGEENTTVVGTGNFDGLTVNTALLIKKNTAQGGRKGRGRMFWPPFNTGEAKASAAGILESSWIGLIQDGLNAWHAAMLTDGLAPVLFHSDPVAGATPITSFTLSGLLATQRRRMR